MAGSDKTAFYVIFVCFSAFLHLLFTSQYCTVMSWLEYERNHSLPIINRRPGADDSTAVPAGRARVNIVPTLFFPDSGNDSFHGLREDLWFVLMYEMSTVRSNHAFSLGRQGFKLLLTGLQQISKFIADPPTLFP